METDAPYHLIWQGHNQKMVEVENGYYILNSNYIYYADKSTMKPILLDSNPNSDCLADQNMPKNCNAFVYLSEMINFHFLAHYDGYLYALEQSIDLKSNLYDIRTYQLTKIAMDGSSREVVHKFDSHPYFMAIHRGVLYTTSARITNPETETYRLLAYDLDRLNKEPEVIFEGNKEQGMIADILPYGKNIYFRESISPYSNNYRYDLQTKETQRMFTEEDTKTSAFINSIHNETVIYTEFYGELMDERGWQANTVSLENENPQQLELNPAFLSYYYGGQDDPNFYRFPQLGYEDFINIEVKNELTVFDSKYKEFTTIPTPQFKNNTTIFAGNSDYMFAYTREADDYKWYVLDKSKIGSGNASFEEWISTPSISFSYYSPPK